MTSATLEDFMAASNQLNPEPEDLMGYAEGQLVPASDGQSSPIDDGVVVVETSDGEIMNVAKRIAFLSPILQLRYVRKPRLSVSSSVR